MAYLRREEGFTLLEVMLALVVLAFGLLAIAIMQATAIKGNSQAMGLTEAVTVAQDRMENLLSLAYSDAELSDTNGDGTGRDADQDGSDDDGVNFGLDRTVDAAGAVVADHSWTDPTGTYTLFWNVAVNQPIQNVKTIRVTVHWTDRGLRRSASFDLTKSDII